MVDGPPAAPRTCGTCTLCCKILTIPEFGNASGEWCPHCVQGKGCGIYPNWPETCRTFQCGYLMWPALGEHWRPSHSKLVVAFKPDGLEIVIHVDPGVPHAWRAAPFYGEIRAMAAQAARDGHKLFVQIGRRVIVVFPDREVDLGVVAEDERIAIGEEGEPGHRRPAARKLKADGSQAV